MSFLNSGVENCTQQQSCCWCGGNMCRGVYQRDLLVWEHLMLSPLLLKYVNCKEEKKIIIFFFFSHLLQLWLITSQGTGKTVGLQTWWLFAGSVRAGPHRKEPSHPCLYQLWDGPDLGEQTLRRKDAHSTSVRIFVVGYTILSPFLIYTTEWNLFHYACFDVPNVYPVSQINVIHSTIAREAIELSMKEVVMDHNGNFNAQQDPLLEW